MNAVTIEIAHRQARVVVTGNYNRSVKRSVTVAEEHTHGVAAARRSRSVGNILLSIGVEIANHQRISAVLLRVCQGERSIALTQINPRISIRSVGDRDIRFVITIEVSQSDRRSLPGSGRGINGYGLPLGEGSVPISQQDRDRTRCSAAYNSRCDRQVELAIFIEIGAERGAADTRFIAYTERCVHRRGREFSSAQPFKEGNLGPCRGFIDRHHVEDAVVIKITRDDRAAATVVKGRGADRKIALGEAQFSHYGGVGLRGCAREAGQEKTG